MIKIENSNFSISEIDPDYQKILEKYGETHTITLVYITTRGVDLRKLKPDESICMGDGKTWYCRLTKKHDNKHENHQRHRAK